MVIDGNYGVYVYMIMRYLFIFRLLQTDPQQLVLMNVCKKRLDASKRKSQIIDVVNY